MSNVIIDDANLYDIADAIREKSESTDTFLPSEMAAAIKAIQGGAKFSMGVITPSLTGGAEVIEHKLGTTPTFIAMWAIDKYMPPSATSFTAYYSISSIYIQKNVNGNWEGRSIIDYTRRLTYYSSKSTSATISYLSYKTNSETTLSTMPTTAQQQNFSSANETSFITPKYLHKNEDYMWIAIAE